MSYFPFERGPLPVGVRTHIWHDRSRDRALPVEIWYPATEKYAGQDLDPEFQDQFMPQLVADGETHVQLLRQAAVRDADIAAGGHRLILFVHGWAGERREASYLCTHLASHGYVVVAPDIVGHTLHDVEGFLAAHQPRADAQALIDHSAQGARNRQGDIPFLLDTVCHEYEVDVTDVGIVGESFGGWTALCAPAWDRRIAACVPMCPVNDLTPVKDASLAPLAFTWHRDVPTLFCVADRDSWLPLYGQLRALREAPASWKRMIILADADHASFSPDLETAQVWLAEFTRRVADTFPDMANFDMVARTVVPPEQLTPGKTAALLWQGLTLAHFDAHLREIADARTVMDGDLAATAATQGATVNIVNGHSSP